MIKKFLDDSIDRFAKSKVYFSRASAYISMVSFSLIFANFKTINNIDIPNYILIIGTIIIILTAGFLDYTYVYSREFTHTNKQNDLKSQLNRIEQMQEVQRIELKKIHEKIR